MKQKILLSVFMLVFLPIAFAANGEGAYINDFKGFMIPVHLVEIALAVFISYIALRFFSITKPVNLFLFIYIALGFFIISSLLYLLMYFALGTMYEVSLVSTYIASRVALVAMLASLVVFFYKWNSLMRKKT